jgi:hypothetical protein
MEDGMPDCGFGRCDGHHKMIDFRLEKNHRRGLRASAAVGRYPQPHCRAFVCYICSRPVMALLGPQEISDLSPQSGEKRTFDQAAATTIL